MLFYYCDIDSLTLINQQVVKFYVPSLSTNRKNSVTGQNSFTCSKTLLNGKEFCEGHKITVSHVRPTGLLTKFVNKLVHQSAGLPDMAVC
mmetsp:Transcript_28698/g.37074  ORF Transcript_28698/g.37074 Transcript_28698/m.37074 type:complete len:90 (-) Transcript_28698:479-748(-)